MLTGSDLGDALAAFLVVGEGLVLGEVVRVPTAFGLGGVGDAGNNASEDGSGSHVECVGFIFNNDNLNKSFDSMPK